jgi:uncharacterized membrane protein
LLDPNERAAIEYLQDQDGQPTIAEALGDDYSDVGIVSAASGLPTILQWPGHELQWRGDADLQTGRPEDLTALYTSSDPSEVLAVVRKYGIDFVYVGPKELAKYEQVTVPQMTSVFALAEEFGNVAVYQVVPGAAAVTQE